MRKSFTRLSSLLVLLLLSIQMVLAVPKLATTGGLSPADGTTNVSPATNPVFTMTFQADVQPGLLEIIGLYNSSGTETKAIQLKADQRSTSADGATVFTHPDGVVSFKGKVVTIQFTGVNWSALQGQQLWITVGANAIKDASGSLDITTAFDGGALADKWDFKILDVVAPTVKALYPKDDAKDVSTSYSVIGGPNVSFAIKFNETVKFVSGYVPSFGDFAVYTSTDSEFPTPQEGGDLVSLMPMSINLFKNGTPYYGDVTAEFDSIILVWNGLQLPQNTALYVRVKPAVIEDLAGNDFAGINNNTGWNFTTKNDAFDKPTISAEHNGSDCSTTLWSDDEFYIDFASGETLYDAFGNKITTTTDLKSFIHVTNYNNETIDIKSAKWASGNRITVVLNRILKTSDVSVKVAIDANAFIDADGNKSKTNERTFAVGNWDAPMVVDGYPKVTNQSGTTMDLLIKTNEPCSVHYIVVRKDRAYKPTDHEVFGHLYQYTDSIWKPGSTTSTSSGLDTYYHITSTMPGSGSYPTMLPAPNFGTFEGKDLWYGKQTKTGTDPEFSMVQIFAEGNISVPTANYEVLKRITGLPATHGIYDTPAAYYEIYYELIDTVCTQGTYASKYWLKNTEHISGVKELVGSTVYTTDILMPEAWFDGDSTYVDGKTKSLNPKKNVPNGTTYNFLAKNGKLYINFNEPIRKFDGNEFSSDATTQSNELKSALYVFQGSKPATYGVNADANWTSNVTYTASLSADKKVVTITPFSSWNSSDTVWVKVRNSKIEDQTGNEVVPYNGLYVQSYKVENYNPPFVRYTYNSVRNPLDSLEGVSYYQGGNPTKAVAPITVTVSGQIHPYVGCLLENDYVIPAGEMVEFSNDSTKLAYIGNFFKIRMGNGDYVNEAVGYPLERNFIFTYKYDKDSTVISIVPKTPLVYESETWYSIQIDGRVQDVNGRTIGEGATLGDSKRPTLFKVIDAQTGNPFTVSGGGWTPTDSLKQDNKTIVFKTEDTVNPKLTFYSKKQSTLLTSLTNLDGLTNVALKDTIGVYIDEYVSLGFDGYVKFDAVTGKYVLDANAMRRYFQVYDYDSTAMSFDVVGLDISALENDSLIFYIDPYYVNADGTPISDSEAANFKSSKTYYVHFNSQAMYDTGVNANFGKTKGVYWDDNHNMVLDKWAKFSTALDPDKSCITATVSPAPSASLKMSDFTKITIALPYAVQYGSTIPGLQISEGNSSVSTTIAGNVATGNANLVEYPISAPTVVLHSDSTYTIHIGGLGQIIINSGNPVANEWPAEACNPNADSTWTYKMLDQVAPHLDTNMVVYNAVANANFPYSDCLYPQDDSTNYDKTKPIVLVFNEPVSLVTNKKLTIYDSSNDTKAIVYAQQCSYGTRKINGKTVDDYHVIIVPTSAFASNLEYLTHYHIAIEAGFVTDRSPLKNAWAGVFVADNVANGVSDGDNDWSFRTAADPAPYFTQFTPADGTAAVSTLTVSFSENVYPQTGGTINVYEITSGNVKTLVPGGSLSVTDPTDVYKVSQQQFKLVGFTPVYGHQYCVLIPTTTFRDATGKALEYACDTTGVAFDDVLPIDAQTDAATGAWYVNFRDAIAPYAINNWPREGAKHVPYNAYIYIEFNEPVSLSDGSAIIPDPQLLNQTIDKFINISRAGNSNVPFEVEFVGNNKKLLRITPVDPQGYNYVSSQENPTMMDATYYTVTLNTQTSSAPTYYLWDSYNNQFGPALIFHFTTEDVIAPVLGTPVITTTDCAKNKFDFQVSIAEASDTARIAYVVMPASTTTAPSASAIFAGTGIDKAQKYGEVGVHLGLNPETINFTIDMGTSFDGAPAFKVYAVARDCEFDIWAPASSAWDSLFMFNLANGYGEGYDHILDIKPSPNKMSAAVVSNSFKVSDNDAPTLLGQYPVNGAVQVPVNDSVYFWFSEKVEKGILSAPNAITLRRWDNNIAVDADVYFRASGKHSDSIFVIKPANVLEQETKYYVEIDRYAVRDSEDVCTGTGVYYPELVGTKYVFTTQDNIGPRFAGATPASAASCVACPNLNADGKETITLDFYDANEVKIASNASDPYVYLYRTATSVSGVRTAWLVVPASQITVTKDAQVDTLYHATIPVQHQYYGSDPIQVIVPAGLIVDKYNNKYTNALSAYSQSPVVTVTAGSLVWNFTTCNTEAPTVQWAVPTLSSFFNYSLPGSGDDGIFANWNETSCKHGVQGDNATGVPTNIALKIIFGEEVAFNTSSTSKENWEALDNFNPAESANNTTTLVPSELMKILKVGGLQYSTTKAASDIDTVIVNTVENSITLLFKYGSYAKLGSSDILTDARIAGNITTNGSSAYLVDYYKARLNDNASYPVTVVANKVKATNYCSKLAVDRYVASNIVTLNTRDDSAPEVSFKNTDGDVLCSGNACIQKNDTIVVSFTKPVVKTSYDVKWLGEESYTYDNLPLTKADLASTNYVEMYKLTTLSGGKYGVRDHAIPVKCVELDPALMNYKVVSDSVFASEGWYEMVFKKYTVKKYIDSDPTGTVFEGGDTCRFRISDYNAPVVLATADANGFVDGFNPQNGSTSVESSTKQIKIVFNDNLKLSTDESLVTNIRRQDGSYFKTFKPSEAELINNIKTDNQDTLVFTVGKFDNFTTYYIEMPAGFVTDDGCNAMPFAGFTAKLDPKTGMLLSADYSFTTSDSTAPELIAVTGDETKRSDEALFPKVGSIVSTNSNLVLVFDENINISIPGSRYKGIVIYHDNGDENSFGNAVEFIPWSNFYNPFVNGNKITVSGSDVYSGLTSNVITIDPATTFDKKGVYYVRVSGDNIVDGSNNAWSSSINSQRDEVTDREWWFTIVNDATPVLVDKTPAYDGVNTPRVYTTVTSETTDLGYVKTNLTMTFKDGVNGDPIDVAAGGSSRMLRIFEYTYDPATAQYKSKPWITLPITDPSIEFVGNVVTVKDVILRDQINGKGASLANDSCYYVTVDAGAIVNGLAASASYWEGISNAFVWRFQTPTDNKFVANADILSPNLVDNGDDAKNLTIEEADSLIVTFGEGIEAKANATGKVQLFVVGQSTPAEEVAVTQSMIKGNKLTVPLHNLVDLTNYYVQIQANAFGDTSTVSTPNTAFGGVGVWEFNTGDNTNPQNPIVAPAAGCVGSTATLTMKFSEPFGVTNVGGAGEIEVKDASGKVWASVSAEEVTIDATKNIVSAVVEGLPDTTLLTVTVPAGFIFDLDEDSPLPNLPITWTFTTGENTAPTVVITPDEVSTPNVDLTLTFSEIVGAVGGKFVKVNGVAIDADSLKSADGLVYTYPLVGLSSETTYMVEVEEGAFIDVNSGCVPNVLAATTDSFKVGDILAPVAVGSPKTAEDYVGLVLSITFDDAVTPATGNIVIYDAKTDAVVETLSVKSDKLTASEDKTVYTFAPEKVKFGQYYVLIDAGAFVDLTAAPIAQACPGISDKTVWPLSIVDPEFVNCITMNSQKPARAEQNVPTTTDVVISFCDERLAPGVGVVTIGDQSADRVLGVNYFEYPVTADMINGNTLTIPVTGLKENTTYSIIIPYGAITDEYGNPFIGITDANLWIFTTGDFTDPVVSVPAVTVKNDGTAEPVAITTSEAGVVFLAEEGVAATKDALNTACGANKAVTAILTAAGSVNVDVKGLKPGNYKAYAFDASGRMGTAVNVVVVFEDPILALTPIKDIQGKAAASPLAGQKVRTKGVVTVKLSNGFYMQDANATWSGIFVSTTEAVSKGSSVEIVGTVSEVDGLTTIGSIESLTFVAPVLTEVTPLVVGPSAALEEMYEGVEVKVTGKASESIKTAADWTISSAASTPYTINNAYYGSYEAKKDYKYEVTGIVIPAAAAYKVLATEIYDWSTANGVEDLANSVKVYPNPFDKYITLSVSNNVVITKAVITNIAGQLVKEVINPNNTISTSELRSGVYFISLHTVDGIAKTERIIKR